MQQKVKIILYVSIIFVGYFLRVSHNKEIRRLSRVDRIHVCNRTFNAALAVKSINILNPAGENAVVNVKAKLRRKMRGEPQMVVQVTRCLSREALDTCVPFTVLKPITTCGLIVMKNTAWSDFVESIHPPLRCPFAVGEYELVNGTLDADLFKFFPIDNFYWRAKFDFVEDIDILSLCAELRAIKIYV